MVLEQIGGAVSGIGEWLLMNILMLFVLFILVIIIKILRGISKTLYFMREDMLDVFAGKYNTKKASEMKEPISKEELEKLKRKIFGESHYGRRGRTT